MTTPDPRKTPKRPKFAHAIREFRNYIHPQQQVKESFRPRRVTAQIARHVLRAAIDDLATRPSTG